MSLLKEKIRASIYLLSYFETLGFGNTSWEFNFGNTKFEKNESAYMWLNIIHNYFALGGFNKIDITDWKSSDDTIMMIATGLGCLIGGNEKNYIDEYVRILPELKNRERASGINTLNILEIIKRTKSISKLDYKKNMGGNGAAMRTSIIGLIYYQEKDLEKLIENSIIASRVTHNYTLGFLGGLVTALFTSFGMRNIPIWEWVDRFLKIYDEGIIDKYMKKTNIYKQYLEDKDFFFDLWRQYSEQRLSKFINFSFDFYLYENRLESLEEYNQFNGNYFYFGSSGISSVIVAYDSLLMGYGCNNTPLDLKDKNLKFSLDSLIFFSTLHFGDNDTTGAIAGAWYGAYFGFKDFDTNKLNQLEFKNELEKLYKRVETYMDSA
mgnify:CR=1 FL=1